MDHVTKHPGHHDFDGIRGKKPAHPDHGHKSHGGQEPEHGGPTGFNHQDGFHGGGKKSSRSSKTTAHDETKGEHGTHEGGGRNATEGGQDFTVPPFKPTRE